MKRIITITLVAVLSIVGLQAQEAYDEILTQIEANSILLQALRDEVAAEQLANKTGLTPADPELEFAYCWGTPSKIGSKINFSAKQGFDFPTVYIHKSKKAKIDNVNADLRYKSERITNLLQAKETVAGLIRLNALSRLMNEQLENAKGLLSSYQKSLENGDCTILDLYKCELNYNNVATQVAQLAVERKELLATLVQLNGGVAIEVTRDAYPPTLLPSDFDEWYATAEEKSPMLKYVKGQIASSERAVKLQRSMWLPKLAAGYTSEYVLGQNYKGASVGVSIPLWENKNKIRQAKAELKSAQTNAENSKIAFYNSLRADFESALVQQRNVASFTASLAKVNGGELLKRSLSLGEISLITYLQEVDYYYNAQRESLENQYELELTLARLFATEL